MKQKTESVDFESLKKSDIRNLIKDMRKLMKKADGIGLSSNQIGLRWRFFIAEVPVEQGGQLKFYAIFNPEIVKQSGETVALEEGCLSVPDTFGLVERPSKIILSGFDLYGRKIKIKAWGLLARVFQHEIDHLNGHLFIEKAKTLEKIPGPKGAS